MANGESGNGNNNLHLGSCIRKKLSLNLESFQWNYFYERNKEK